MIHHEDELGGAMNVNQVGDIMQLGLQGTFEASCANQSAYYSIENIIKLRGFLPQGESTLCKKKKTSTCKHA